MTTKKEKKNIIVCKLGITETVKNNESKASLFRKCGIQEETMCGWIKEGKKIFICRLNRRRRSSTKEED
jgi:hypothetical protein